MTFLTRKSLSRRTLLRGTGVALALPLLDSMVPALAAAPSPTRRFAFLYTPNGIIMRDWTPSSTGTDFAFSPTLAPLEPYREKTLVLTGLAHHNGQGLGDGNGDHARAGASWLTGAHPRKTEGADLQSGVSFDQVLARHFAAQTRLPSLELGLEDVRLVGGCDSGYSCAYSNTVSWSSPTTPIPYEPNPRAVFERLFGDGETTDPAARAARAREDASILDFVAGRARSLALNLGTEDRRKMSDYLDSVRETERRIQQAEASNRVNKLPAMDRPSGIPPTFEEHIQLMFDLVALAFHADLTRVVTLMYGREGGNRTYRSIGVPEAHHGLSHHMTDPAKMAKLQKIDQYHVEMLAAFLSRLNGYASLLDETTVVYGSSLSDSNRHLHDNLPVLVLGGGGGQLHPARHVAYPARTPMTNLYVALAGQMGLPLETFGDSNGSLADL